jgi:hypothetical protein
MARESAGFVLTSVAIVPSGFDGKSELGMLVYVEQDVAEAMNLLNRVVVD